MADPSAAASAERLAQLRLAQLRKRLRAAEEEHALLKQGIRDEVDAQAGNRRAERLRAQLAHLRENEAREGSRLCYGLPPDWSASNGGGSSLAGGGASAGSGDCWSGEWLEGTEVEYTVRVGGASSVAAGSERLEVAHKMRRVQLQLYSLPFAHGGLRQAFYAK